jgi:hypothetical protein
MEICTAAGLSLVIVDRCCSATSNDAEESILLIPYPAPNAGAYGGGHRNRLTLWTAWISLTRLTSQDVSGVLELVKRHLLDVLRRLT